MHWRDSDPRFGPDQNKKKMQEAWDMFMARNRNSEAQSLLFAAFFEDNLLIAKRLLEVMPTAFRADTIISIARECNTDALRWLLAEGFDINTVDASHTTALMAVCIENKFETAKLLIDNGADITLRDASGRTAFDIALEHKREDIVRLFLQHKGFDRDFCQRSRGAACSFGSDEVISAMIAKGTDFSDDKCYSPLYHAMSQRNQNAAVILVEHGVDISLPRKGVLPIEYAMKEHLTQVIFAIARRGGFPVSVCPLAFMKNEELHALLPILIKNGMDVNIPLNSEKPDDLLALAIEKLHDPEIIALLLDHGANAKKKYNGGRTCLHLALGYYYSIDVLNMLLAAGADVNAVSDNGDAMIHQVMFGNKDILRLFIDRGVDVNALNRQKESALSCVKGDEELMEILLKAGANYMWSKDENSVLRNAFVHGESAVLLLQKYGMDIKKSAAWLNIPHVLASEPTKPSTFRLLIRFGVDINARHTSGQTTPLDCAIMNHKSNIAPLLECGADPFKITGTASAIVLKFQNMVRARTFAILHCTGNVEVEDLPSKRKKAAGPSCTCRGRRHDPHCSQWHPLNHPERNHVARLSPLCLETLIDELCEVDSPATEKQTASVSFNFTAGNSPPPTTGTRFSTYHF